MCVMKAPKMPEPAKPAAPPPPVEKSVDELDISRERDRTYASARSGMNKLKINRTL